MIAPLTEKCLHSLSAALYGSYKTPEPGDSCIPWNLVHSSSHAEPLFGPLHSIDGDHSDGYHSHQDLYSVTMSVILCVAQSRQLVQMPAAAPSICRTSEQLQHRLVQWDTSRCRPHWMSLRMQWDCLNPGIWSGFLCVHQYPFLHTYGLYPDDPQNTWLATTSNDKCWQEEVNIVPLIVEEVHQGECFYVSLVPEGAYRLIRSFC